jgi:hypothetical protein
LKSGKLNTTVLRAAGPCEPEIEVLYVESFRRRAVATYVISAVHPDTVGGLEFSADFPITLSRLLDTSGPFWVRSELVSLALQSWSRAK